MLDHLTSIVAIDRQGAIGCKNQLPWSIKSDMAFFRKTTMGNTVVMGRKTHESIGGCLKGRKNLVLSHRFDLFPSTEDCMLVNFVEEAMVAAAGHTGRESFIVGGAATYLAFSEYVDRYLVTFVEHETSEADAFLSSEILDEFNGWQAEEVASFPQSEGKDQFAFRIMRFDAPDAMERREARKAVTNQWLERLKSGRILKAPRKGAMDKSAQTAFSF